MLAKGRSAIAGGPPVRLRDKGPSPVRGSELQAKDPRLRIHAISTATNVKMDEIWRLTLFLELGQKGYDGFLRWWCREAHMKAYFALLEDAARKKSGSAPWLA